VGREVFETEGSQWAGDGKLRVGRIRETGGSTVGLGDKELTVSKIRDIMKRQERCKGILGIWFSPLWSAGSKANENHLIQRRGQFLHRGPGQ